MLLLPRASGMAWVTFRNFVSGGLLPQNRQTRFFLSTTAQVAGAFACVLGVVGILPATEVNRENHNGISSGHTGNASRHSTSMLRLRARGRSSFLKGHFCPSRS